MSETTHTHPTDSVKRLERSRSDRMFAGVCGGLARYFDIHPAVYRVGFVVLTLLGGSGIVMYIVAALVIPDEGKEDSFATRILKERRDRPWPLIGLGLVGIALASWLAKATLWPRGDASLLLAVLGVAILRITRHSRRVATEPVEMAREDSRRMRRFFVGISIAFGTLVALVLVATAIFAAVFHVHVGNGVGDRNYHAATTQDLHASYKLGIGNLVLDLRDVSFADHPTKLNVRVDVGKLHILLPPGTPVRVVGTAQAGKVEILGRNDDGQHAEVRTHPVRQPLLTLDAHVGAGLVQVTRGDGR